jgi:trehalose-6-phosphatase
MMIQDAQSIFLSSGCFLDALISGQLDPTAWSPFVPSQHALSTPDVEVQCRTAQRLLLVLDCDSILAPNEARSEEVLPPLAWLLPLSQLAQAPDVEVVVVSGRPLAELRALFPVPSINYLGTLGVPKEKALQSLFPLSNTDTLPVYFGDAATVEEVFHTVNGRGLTILIAHSPGRTAARYYLQTSAEVSCFLARVLSLRQNRSE